MRRKAKDESEEQGRSYMETLMRGGSKIPLPPKLPVPVPAPPAPGGGGSPAPGAGAGTKPKPTKPKSPLMGGKGNTGSDGKTETESTYDAYIKKQEREAAAAKRKSGNRYIDQANTLSLQADALRALLGKGPDKFGPGGKVGEGKGKGPKGVTIGHGWASWNSATDKNAGDYPDVPKDDPRSRIKGPFGLTAEPRGGTGLGGKLKPTNMKRGRL